MKMNTSKYNELQQTISELLKQSKIDWTQVLSEIIASYNCSTGTIHFLEEGTSLLNVQAHKGIPEFLLPKLSTMPIGKGMAGIAAERKEAVEMCNLQTDTSGVARPAAKETKVEGAIAVPMLLNGELFGIFGIAKSVSYDFNKEEIDSLLRLGEEICKFLK
jgi:putative methionine-R-sulfoxide reductase with GAF domain